MIKLVYDKTVSTSYGVWVCPACKAAFYGGGPALHKRACLQTDYAACEHHFGDEQIRAVIERGAAAGPDAEWCGISLNDLRRQFPELLLGHGE